MRCGIIGVRHRRPLWVVLACRKEEFGKLAEDKRWQRLAGRPAAGMWTDDYSNLLSVFRWRD